MKRTYWIILLIALLIIVTVLLGVLLANDRGSPTDAGETTTTSFNWETATIPSDTVPDGEGSADLPSGTTLPAQESVQPSAGTNGEENVPTMPEDIFQEEDLPTAPKTEPVTTEPTEQPQPTRPDYGGIVLPDDDLEDLM